MSNYIVPAYEMEPIKDQDSFDEIIGDFKSFCAKGLFVINKQGKVVPFILNEAQELYAEHFFTQFLAPVPVPINDVILKARQIGFSTLVAAINAYICLRVTNYSIVYAMPDKDTAQSFLEDKFRPLLESLHPALLPKTLAYKKGHFIFEEFDGVKLNNQVLGVSARTKSAGRSKTVQGGIFDEYAYYENVTGFEKGIMATIPKVGRSFKIFFSTANGLNHMYDLWKTAGEDNGWRRFFYPWHMLSEYEMDGDPIQDLSIYEMNLLAIFEEEGYPQETWSKKIHWWRYTFKTEAKGDMDYMSENYPATATEAFISSGVPIFNLAKLVELENNSEPFVYVEPREATRQTAWDVVSKSSIKIYDAPNPQGKYIIGIDPSEGGEQGDYSVAVVADVYNLKTVAVLREKLDQNELAETVVELAKYYNNARLIPERNRGQAFISWAKRLGYNRFYVDPKYKKVSNTNLGVYMTRAVKNDLITDFKFLFNNGIYKDYDHDFIEEAKHFVRKDGKSRGDGGFHDDSIMARLLLCKGFDMRHIKRSYEDGLYD